ncbi:Insulinase-like protein [Euroglyphus maynei]|uniref:Insulinase-like protein n=1 Tax=Euroglyphus maynei TaxID=6958 RepID=A0A1Y3BNM0_EURMA|nr:Insulinase-like protein [Euroglyphus maynei]
MALNLIRSSLLAGKTCVGVRYSHHAAHKFSHALKSGGQTNVAELSNGIRVATEQTNSPSATVGVWIDSGCSSEPKELNGIAHFIEHLIFRGSKNRTKKQLEQEVHGLGAILNSYTQRDSAGYSMTLAPKDMAKAVEILADLIQNPTLNADEIESTRQYILNELNEQESNYEQVAMDHLHSVAYQQTPLAQSKYGPTANIERFTKADIERGLDLLFKGPQMIVAASGPINHDQICKDAEKHMKNVTNIFEKNMIPSLTANRYTGSDIRVRDDSMPCAHVAIAVQGPGYADPDFIAMDVAASLMGRWDLTHGGGINVSCYMGMVSNMDHLAQSFQSFNLKYKDTALWGSYFVGERMQLEEFVWHLQTQWRRLCIEVANNEIKLGKNILMTNLICEREGSANNANSIAADMMRFGRRITLEEWAERINRVNSAKLHSLAENYIWDRCPVVAAVGPVENLPLYEELRMKMSWIRY